MQSAVSEILRPHFIGSVFGAFIKLKVAPGASARFALPAAFE
jgi:hypothetical protein